MPCLEVENEQLSQVWENWGLPVTREKGFVPGVALVLIGALYWSIVFPKELYIILMGPNIRHQYTQVTWSYPNLALTPIILHGQITDGQLLPQLVTLENTS